MKNSLPVNLPYFDYLLQALAEKDPDIVKSFGRHVHWGYWKAPRQARMTADDFALAADNLSHQLSLAACIADGQTVLDVGCGFGGTVALLNEEHQNMQLHGLNIDPRQLQRARQSIVPQESNTVQFHQGNACVLPFADNTFDAVLAVECIFHFPDRAAFFQEALRVLKPGGILALSDFIPVTPIKPLFVVTQFLPTGAGFYGNCKVTYTVNDYRKLANNTGFISDMQEDITGNTLPTYRYLRSLAQQNEVRDLTAAFETLAIELLSRSRLLKYMIFAFIKPE